jgi:outer membrane protein assembly factor BamD (BamD/ComL family)
MRISGYISRILLCLTCLMPMLARSQEDNFADKEDDDAAPKRKAPSFFHKPEAATPAEQLALADGLRREGKTRQAIRQYDSLVHEWHDTPEAVSAQRAQADVLLERGKNKDSFDAYQYMIDFYAGQFPFEPVIEKQFQIANVIKNERHARFWILPGVTDPQLALPLLETVVQNAPTWERSQEALNTIAQIHEQAGDFDKAAEQYERVQLRYPDGRYAATAAFSRARCLYHNAMQRGRDEGQLRTVLSAYASFMHDFPSDENAAAARTRLDEIKERLSQMCFERAMYYDRAEKNDKAAIVAYRDFVRTFPMSPLREQAESRIAELSSKTGKKP